jgi:acetamidase/formamidase
VSGPIFIEGAEKEDALVVGIKSIKPLTGQGAARVGARNPGRCRARDYVVY